MVARSLDLQAGDEIVSTTHEYGGNEPLWRYVCDRRGARYIEVDTVPARALGDLLGAVTPRTRALFVSHISSPTALRFPVDELCRARARPACSRSSTARMLRARSRSTSTRSARTSTRATATSGSALQGRGIPVRAARRTAAARTARRQLGLDAGEWADRHRWAGTRDVSPHLAVPAAIDFQAAHDWDAVRARCHALATLAAQELSGLGLEPLPDDDGEFVQMIAFRMPPCDPEQVDVAARTRAPDRGARTGVARATDAARLVPGLQRRARPGCAADGAASGPVVLLRARRAAGLGG